MQLTADLVDPKGPPFRSAEWHGDLDPALFAVIGILGAIRHRDRTGEGQMVDVAQLDCMVAQTGVPITGYLMSGMTPLEMSRKYMGLRFVGAYKAKDGYVWLHPSPRMEEQLKRGLGLEELENREEIQDWVAKKTVREVVDTMVDVDVPVAPVYQVDQVVEDQQIRSRGMIVSIEHPTAGMIKLPNFPVKFSNTPAEVRDPAPILGQHNEQVLTDLLGYRAEEIAKLRKEGVII
jgi:crotonobetainyl-CoA:carnitine CoA-transferase CaiB-like acyl-CoA transferase